MSKIDHPAAPVKGYDFAIRQRFSIQPELREANDWQ
jgi:hypothetical protein